MKKSMLYLSVGFGAFYLLAILAVLLFQKAFRPIFGLNSQISVFPVMDIGWIILSVGLAVLFGFLLMGSDKRSGIGMEMAALIALAVLFVVEPCASYVINFAQNLFLGNHVEAIAGYAVLKNVISLVKPIYLVQVFLVVIYAGISIGYKKTARIRAEGEDRF